MNAAPSPWPSWLDEPLERGLAHRAHALLLHGPGDLGQFDLALALARGWLCETPVRGRACGRCAACRLMDGGSHADFLLLVPEALRATLGVPAAEGEGDEEEGKAKAKASREIRVDALRRAIDWCHTTAARGGAKVLLIHPAEAMNDITANALLKTLEEPPGALRILLTAQEPEALLPTLRSRCQRLPIAVPATEVATSWLGAQGVEDAARLLAAAGGRPHAARALHGEGIDGATWAAVPQVVRRGQAQALSGWPVPRVVEALHKLCHDLLAVHTGAAPRFFEVTALAAALQPAAPALDALLRWQRALVLAARQSEHPWHAPLRVEALVLEAAGLWQTARPLAPARGGALATLPGR